MEGHWWREIAEDISHQRTVLLRLKTMVAFLYANSLIIYIADSGSPCYCQRAYTSSHHLKHRLCVVKMKTEMNSILLASACRSLSWLKYVTFLYCSSIAIATTLQKLKTNFLLALSPPWSLCDNRVQSMYLKLGDDEIKCQDVMFFLSS